MGVIQAESQLILSWVTYFWFQWHFQEEPCLGSCCSACLFSVIYWRLALFLVWVVKLSSRSSFSLNCSEMHHVHTLTSKTMRNSLNNLFILTNQNLRITIAFYKITKRTLYCHYSWVYIFTSFTLGSCFWGRSMILKLGVFRMKDWRALLLIPRWIVEWRRIVQ